MIFLTETHAKISLLPFSRFPGIVLTFHIMEYFLRHRKIFFKLDNNFQIWL